MADFDLTVPVFGRMTFPGWSRHAFAILAIVVSSGATYRYFAPPTDQQEILAKRLTEAQTIAAEYRKHLGEPPVPIYAKGTRQVSAYESDDCILDRTASGIRLILPIAPSAPPLVATHYETFEGIVHAATVGPTPCPFHQNDKPSKTEGLGTTGCWVSERWTYRDGCVANFHQDRCSGQIVLDFLRCQH